MGDSQRWAGEEEGRPVDNGQEIRKVKGSVVLVTGVVSCLNFNRVHPLLQLLV